MGYGIKSISYFIHGPSSGLVGYEKSPPLLAEIKRLNADFKKLEPWLGGALPLSREIVGTKVSGFCVSTLWDGNTDSLLVVLRNLDYKTDRESNDLGQKPRFKITPKEKVQIDIPKPAWLTVAEATDPLTGEAVVSRVQEGTIRLDVGALTLGKIVVIQNSKAAAKQP